jgi:DNA-binding NarL/FixJ family response regulator
MVSSIDESRSDFDDRPDGDDAAQRAPRFIRILSVDEHPLVREGLAKLINAEPDMTILGEANNGSEAICQFRARRPDVTVMELRLPDMSGIDALITIRKEFPAARVIVLTIVECHLEIVRAFKEGAAGYFLKTTSPDDLRSAIRQVHAGRKCVPPEVAGRLIDVLHENPLTPREISVLQEVAAGFRNHEIGERLSMAEETVKVHVKRILQKLGARDRTHAVVIALRRGIIHL